MSQLIKDKTSGLDYVVVGETASPKHILVMLHGSGRDYADMEMAAKFFVKKMPDTAIIIPNAPFRFVDILPPEQAEQIKNSGMDADKMRSWFDAAKVEGLSERAAMRAVLRKTEETAEKMNAFIDSMMAKYGLTESNTAVYGFSQGGVLALHESLGRFTPLAAVVSHSGYMLGADYTFSKPRTLLIVGDKEIADDMPMQDLHVETSALLADLGFSVTEHVSPGLAHGLNMDTVNTATSFINSALAGPTVEVKAGLSSIFAKFTAEAVPVRKMFRETPAGRETTYIEILDRESDLMKSFRKAAVEAGFRDMRVLSPKDTRVDESVNDRLTAVLQKGQDGQYHLGGFKAG